MIVARTMCVQDTVNAPMSDRIEHLRRMLDADPADPFCLYALGMEYAAQGHPSTAIAHLEQSLKSDEDQPYAWFHMARCHAAMGDTAKAAAAVDAGLNIATRLDDHGAASELAALRDEFV